MIANNFTDRLNSITSNDELNFSKVNPQPIRCDSPVHIYEVPDIELPFTNTSNSAPVKMQRNPAYATNGPYSTAQITSTSNSTPVKMQRNPAYAMIGAYSTAQITSTSNSTPVKMQRNPAYAAINHTPLAS